MPVGKRCDGSGLWLHKRADGAQWVLRATEHGRRREIGLGSLDVVKHVGWDLKSSRIDGRVNKKSGIFVINVDGANPGDWFSGRNLDLLAEYYTPVALRRNTVACADDTR